MILICMCHVLKVVVRVGRQWRLLWRSKLRAAQKFLASVRHLPSFEEAKARQVEVLTKKMAALPVSVEQAAALVDVLDASIWAGSLDKLKVSVRIEEPGVGRKNTPVQDYMGHSQVFECNFLEVSV